MNRKVRNVILKCKRRTSGQIAKNKSKDLKGDMDSSSVEARKA
jgi:hypothetical protein